MDPQALDDAVLAMARHHGLALSRPQRDRLARAAARLDLDPPALAQALGPAAAPTTRQALLAAVLVGETHWFRDVAQLEAVAQLLADVPPAARTIWTPGCATGQEAHSLLVVLHRAGVWPVQVIATDIDAEAVAVAAAGRYDLRRERGLDGDTVARWGSVQADGSTWLVDRTLRDRVRFRPHDLLADDPVPAQVILCRNVLIYLTPDAITAAIERMGRALAADGAMVLGHSEGLMPGPAWRAERIGGTFAFRRADAVPTGAAATRPAAPGSAAPASAAPGPAPTAPRPGRPTPEPATPASPPAAHDDAQQLLADGEAALAEGRPHDAIAPLRAARYLRTDDPLAAALLGLALAGAGHRAEARRALDALAALLDGAEGTLAGGYPATALRGLAAALADEVDR